MNDSDIPFGIPWDIHQNTMGCVYYIYILHIYIYIDIQHKLYHFSYNQETGISIMLVGETMNHWDVLGYDCDFLCRNMP